MASVNPSSSTHHVSITDSVSESTILLEDTNKKGCITKILQFIMSDMGYLSVLMIASFVIPFEGENILGSPSPFFSILFRCMLAILVFSLTYLLRLDVFKPFITFALMTGTIIFIPKQVISLVQFLRS